VRRVAPKAFGAGVRKGGKPRTVELPKGIHLSRRRRRATCSGKSGTFGTPGGTVIFSLGRVLTGGSKKTAEFAVKHNKPCLHAHSGQEDVAQALRDFVANNEILTLNVAGPRESKEPGIAEFVREVLEKAFPQ
jgi:hypothetical protein